MNALMSFKRTTRTSQAGSTNAGHTPDPLLDSTVALDEIPESHFSTLKFLDIKREQAQSTGTQTAPQTLQGTAQTATVPASPVLPENKVNSIGAVNATSANNKPSRMHVFRERVLQERSDALNLPFISKRPVSTLLLTGLDTHHGQTTATQVDPLTALIHSSFEVAQARLQASDEAAPRHLSNDGSTAFIQANYCLTRATDRVDVLLSQYLPDSSPRKPLRLQLPDSDGFDFCAGAADLFTVQGNHAAHRITEDDNQRTITIGLPSRLAVDSMTAAHRLRQRPADLPAFAGWFDEDGFACDSGCSPIETFVQAELLGLQQQTQRMLKQAQRLAQHLQVHCPNLHALEAMHNRLQADAWVAQHGNAPQASLYRLLDCPVIDRSETEAATDDGNQSLLTWWSRNPGRMPALRDIELPQVPVGLQLLRSLARVAASETGVADYEQLAIFDCLLRKPVKSIRADAQNLPVDLGVVSADALSALNRQLQERFADLPQRLLAAGLSD